MAEAGQPVSAAHLMAKLQGTRGAMPTQSAQMVLGSIGRESSFKQSLRSLRKKSVVADSGFTTFTSGIRAGWQREVVSQKFRQAVLAEFVATAIFVAVATCAVVFGSTFEPAAAPWNSGRVVSVSLVFGLLICVLVFGTGGISGGNINPAVTLSLWVTRKMSWLRATAYILAQCAGATVGALYVRSLSPDLFDLFGGGANGLNLERRGITLWTALGGEILGTGLLVFTVCAAADVGREKANKYVGALTPLMIGLAVTVAHVMLLPIDGCSINPARSFGSAVAATKWDYHWVFWIGPMVGGPLTAVLYELVFKAQDLAHGGADDEGGGGGIERSMSSGSNGSIANVAAQLAASEEGLSSLPSSPPLMPQSHGGAFSAGTVSTSMATRGMLAPPPGAAGVGVWPTAGANGPVFAGAAHARPGSVNGVGGGGGNGSGGDPGSPHGGSMSEHVSLVHAGANHVISHGAAAGAHVGTNVGSAAGAAAGGAVGGFAGAAVGAHYGAKYGAHYGAAVGGAAAQQVVTSASAALAAQQAAAAQQHAAAQAALMSTPLSAAQLAALPVAAPVAPSPHSLLPPPPPQATSFVNPLSAAGAAGSPGLGGRIAGMSRDDRVAAAGGSGGSGMSMLGGGGGGGGGSAGLDVYANPAAPRKNGDWR